MAIKLFIFWVLGLFFGGGGNAQPSIQWQKCYGGSEYDYASSLQHTNDNGYIVAGFVESHDGDVSSNAGTFDFWIVKLDQFGSIQWEKTFGGGDDDRAQNIKQTNDGGYIVAGYTASNDGDVSGNHGGIYDAWVLKLSSTGALEWQKCFGGSGWDEANAVEQTPDGGYIVAGTGSSNDGDISGNHGSSDFWVLKLTENGNIEWQKSLGGSKSDRATSIKQTSDGDYIIVGETQSIDGDVSGNNGDYDIWVVKLSPSGDLEWQNTLGGANLDSGGDIVETSDGFVVCGHVGSQNTGDVLENHGFFDYWIVKLDKTGQLIWQKTFGGTNADYARSIIQTSDGMLLIVGEAKSNNGDVEGNNGIQIVWVLKLDQSGSLIWKKPLGGTQGEGCWSVQQTSDEGYILAGYSWSNDGDVSGNHGQADFWIVKLAPESSLTSTPQSLNLQIYPNPATSTISLDIPNSFQTQETQTLSIQITDLLGQVLSHQTISADQSIDVSALPNGLYLLSAIMPDGTVFSGKFSKLD